MNEQEILAFLPAHIATRLRRVGQCLVWDGPKTPYGYGKVGVGRDKYKMAHRFVYELLVGPIPDGLQIDHLCRNRPCVLPGHLEVVTSRENIMRGTNPVAVVMRTGCCIHGHLLTEANVLLRRRPDGLRRECRICRRDRKRQMRARRKVA